MRYFENVEPVGTLNIDPLLYIIRTIKNSLASKALGDLTLKYHEIDLEDSTRLINGTEFEEEIAKLGGRVVCDSVVVYSNPDIMFQWIVIQFENGCLKYLKSKKKNTDKVFINNLDGCSICPNLSKQLLRIVRKYVEIELPPSHVHSLMANGDNLVLESLGQINKPLVRENYTEEVIKDIDHVIYDLKNLKPCGKLVVIDGPPGTGKSSLIESLLSIEELMFILVPSHQLIQWGNPQLLKLLLKHKETTKNQMVFIIEDADECLVNRDNGGSNKNAISTLLNMSDGILGNLLDLRIIVTTNASTQDFDPAIIRDSRLCKRIEVNELPIAMANKVYQRLTNTDKNPFNSPATLAEIYKLSNSPDSVQQDKKKTAKVGFIK